MGSAITRNTTVSTRETLTSSVKLLPMIRSGLLQVAPALGNGGPGRSAKGHQGRKGGNHHDDGQAYPHAGEASLPTVSTGCMWPI